MILWLDNAVDKTFEAAQKIPKIHDRVLGHQTRVLSHLMHPNTLQRIMDSGLYGNQYGLSAFMSDLDDAIFKVDNKGNVNTFRQNLQAVYVRRLIEMVTGTSANRFKVPAKSLAVYHLNKIEKRTKSPKGDVSSIAHRATFKYFDYKCAQRNQVSKGYFRISYKPRLLPFLIESFFCKFII